MPGIVDPTSINNSRQVAGSSTNTCAKNKNINSINLECEKAQDIQFLEVGKQTLVKFKTKGSNWVFSSEKVTVEINPTGIFQLSTTSWDAQPDWILLTNITTNSIGGEATLQFKVDGCPINSIKLTTKINITSDIFSQEDINKLKTFFIDNVKKMSTAEHKDCITTLNHAIRLLYMEPQLQLGSQISGTDKKWNSGTMPILNKKGRANIHFTIDYLNKNNKTCSRRQPYKAEKMKTSLFQTINNTLDSKIGYHIFAIGIMDGYHSMILTVDNRFPCNKKYILSDQLPNNASYNYTDGWLELTGEELDAWILRKTSVWHENHDAYAGTLVWKLNK